MFCLNKNIVNTFIEKLKTAEIDPKKLSEMSSQERRELFSEFMGEKNAEKTNALFEKKLLMKDQQQAMINWAKQVTGIKPEARRDIISRVEKMTELLTPENEKAFLSDLAAHKLGVTVTMEEASMIAELGAKVTKTKSAIQKGGDRMEYGRAMVKFGDYVSDLKNEARKITIGDIARSPGDAAIKGVVEVAGFAKSLKASIDNSVIGRQGLKTLFANPVIWLKNSAQSFVDMVKVFGGKEVLKEAQADVLSRPNAMNGLYNREKLAIGVIEEAYPTSLPEKVPVLGRLFKASQEAFTAWQYRTRADVFDKYVEVAEKTDADITGIGRVVNSLTGRGSIGPLEPISKGLNNVFFSPRFLKSNIDILTVHAFDKEIGGFARKQAALNTLKVVSGVSAVLTIANAINPGSVEEDARSADFGKIKVGNTRFEVTGGISSIATLAFRLARNSSKSSTTGKVKELNSGKFGALTKEDVLWNFAKNKFSPAMSVFYDILIEGKDSEGKEPTLLGELDALLTPLPVSNYLELKNDPNSANILVAMIADGLGIGTNTYSKRKK